MPPGTLRIGDGHKLHRRGRIAGHPCGLSGPRHVACPLCSGMAANGSLLVGAGHAPPADTSLPPGTLRIRNGHKLHRRGRIAGHPCGPSGPRHVACPLCPATAANIPPSVGAGLQGTLAGYPARRNIPLPPPTPQWPRSFPHTSLHSPLSTLHSSLSNKYSPHPPH